MSEEKVPYSDPAIMRAYQRTWCRNRRAEFFEGARCVYCHTAKNLEVNHIVPVSLSEGRLGHRIWSRRRELIEQELAHCEPACRKCNHAHALANGVGRPGAKLSLADVNTIREAAGSATTAELAERFGVSANTIRDVISHRTFKDVPVSESDSSAIEWKAAA